MRSSNAKVSSAGNPLEGSGSSNAASAAMASLEGKTRRVAFPSM